jgi:hypothetical protein
MKLIVRGQIFPKVWDIAESVRKLRDDRKPVNIGAGTVGFPVYEVELPDDTRKEGLYFITPQGIRLYFYPGDQYQIGYLISELDRDPLTAKHFEEIVQSTLS